MTQQKTSKTKDANPLSSQAGARKEDDVSLLEKAKSLRNHATDAEQYLWYHLRAHRFLGLKFKRQKPIGSYIVDFVCFAPSLVVEVDGGQHADQVAYDEKRSAYLRRQGFLVLRFWNNQVLNETEAVLEAIRQAVLTLSPSPQAGEESEVFSPHPLAGEGAPKGRERDCGSAGANVWEKA